MRNLIISIIIIAVFALGAILAFTLDNSDLRPSEDHVTNYVSPRSRYAVKTLYDENNSPIDIVIVDAKSGVSVAGIEEDAYSYEISEISSTIKFVLYDNEGVQTAVYEFDTKKGEWINQ